MVPTHYADIAFALAPVDRRHESNLGLARAIPPVPFQRRFRPGPPTFASPELIHVGGGVNVQHIAFDGETQKQTERFHRIIRLRGGVLKLVTIGKNETPGKAYPLASGATISQGLPEFITPPFPPRPLR